MPPTWHLPPPSSHTESVNDIPTARNRTYQTHKGVPLRVLAPGLASGITDVDGGTISVKAESKATAHGSVAIQADGSFNYTPAAAYLGEDAFDYVSIWTPAKTGRQGQGSWAAEG